MPGNKGGTAACGSKKPTSAKGSRPERQGKKKRLLNMKEKGEVLDKDLGNEFEGFALADHAPE